MKLIQLPAAGLPAARGLFQGAHLELVIDGVIAGNSMGRLWADDPAQPRAALLWDGRHCFYLGGEASSEAACAMNDIFSNVILPEARARGLSVFKAVGSGAGWGAKEGRQVFAPLPVEVFPRVFFGGAPVDAGWRERVPEGFEVRPIDRALLARRELGNMAGLVEEIEECWPSVEHFLARGFGMCVLRGEEIVSRCTAEYLSPGKCGIGILTEEAWQGKGLAKLAAQAFIEASAARGLVPHWDAWTNNRPSVVVAEKVGFTRLADYQAFFGLYHPKTEE